MQVDSQKSEIVANVKTLIAKAVNLDPRSTQSLDPNTPLGEEGLALDSIDVLEIIVTVEHAYGIKVPSPEVGKKYFRSIDGIADFVLSHRGQA